MLKTMFKKGNKPWNRGLSKSTDERVRKNALSLLGHVVTLETRIKIKKNNRASDPSVRKKMSESHIGKKLSFTTRKKQSEALRGIKSHLWKGGITPINYLARRSSEYRIWREQVFSRDRYKCVLCGDAKGGNLNADHILPFAFYPKLRFDINNGRTLCVECHRKTDTFGARIRFSKI